MEELKHKQGILAKLEFILKEALTRVEYLKEKDKNASAQSAAQPVTPKNTSELLVELVDQHGSSLEIQMAANNLKIFSNA